MSVFNVVRPIVKPIVRSIVNPRGGGYDPDIVAFKAESGATDLSGLNDLVKYLKAESLYSNFVIYPMKSAQNAGSGATVYSLGGLTTNDATIVGGATWNANGFDTNGINQYFTIPDFLGNMNTTMWLRHTPPSADVLSASLLFGQVVAASNNRNVFAFYGATSDDLVLARSSDGGNVNQEQYATAASFVTASEKTISATWVNGGGRSARQNGSNISLPTLVGLEQTSGFDTSVAVSCCATADGSLPATFNDVKAFATYNGVTPLTTTQDDAITTLINAL